MIKTLYRSIMATAVLALLLCGVYPMVVYGLGKIFFADNAGGGIVYRGGHAVGAKLIGQAFTKPEYFHGRPSAAGNGYDAANSSGSNLGPTNQKLADGLKSNVEAFLKENPTVKNGEVPTQLVTASGSGLDPHISPEAAMVQVARVATARHASADAVRELVNGQVEGPQWGLLGESVVNVLMLNLALDEKFPVKK
ncbi:MAG: potassium-transporting ATPase subunit KdpC [Bdellovibrionota bacterium]